MTPGEQRPLHMRKVVLLLLLLLASAATSKAHGIASSSRHHRRGLQSSFGSTNQSNARPPAINQPSSSKTRVLSRCGAVRAPVDSPAMQALARSEVQAATDALFSATVHVVFHVIHDGEVGRVPETQLQQQMVVINQAFADTGFSFELLNITYTGNPVWFSNLSDPDLSFGSTEREMKHALRVGNSSTLNVFIMDLDPLGYLGFAEFPYRTMSRPNSPLLVRDGVLLNYRALPGGGLRLYNLGHTLTHELGHWLGLFHTFQGGCVQGNRGDFIADTPAQQMPNFETCDTNKDSCSALRFPDTIVLVTASGCCLVQLQFSPNKPELTFNVANLAEVVPGEDGASFVAEVVPALKLRWCLLNTQINPAATVATAAATALAATANGKDPVQNFMDYSPDDCYTSFTPMQIARMRRAWTLYRAPQQ